MSLAAEDGFSSAESLTQTGALSASTVVGRRVV